jgi:RNA polymerase sigma-70 factor (ECF subfamily)
MNLQTEIKTASTAKSTSTQTEMDEIKKVRAGDIKAFEHIMRRYNQRLYRIARSILKDEHEAMDVVQEAYIKAYYELHQFKGPDGFASWISRITRNEALMRIRKSQRIDYILDDPMNKQPEPESNSQPPLDSVASQQLRKLLEEAIDTLPLENRCVYVMRAIQQLSTRETASSLELTEQAVKTRFMRAKNELRKVFESHIEKAGLEVHEFAGDRCDFIVNSVLDKLNNTA